METEAVKVEGGYVVNGSKMWITNAGIADVIVVWAKLDGAVRGFLMDTGLPGRNAEGHPQQALHAHERHRAHSTSTRFVWVMTRSFRVRAV